MPCEDGAALLEEYRIRLSEYGVAVRRMRRSAEVSAMEYQELWKVVDVALTECLTVQRKLCAHFAHHRCDSPDHPFRRWAA